MGGDADSVGSVVGMLAGGLYGANDEVLEFYKWVQKWDEDKVIIRAYKLFHHKGV